MVEIRKILVAVGVVAMLGGCGLKLQSARDATPPQDAFANGLYTGYVDLAESEYGEADYQDSDVFARRALAASSGDWSQPEEISARALPEDGVGPLSAARQKLVSALDASARSKVPDQASNAQVMFECWMQEKEENFQPEDIARCRAGFEQAMSAIEVAMAPPAPAPAPREEVVAVEQAPAPAPVRQYTVFFDFDSATVDDVAMAEIERAVGDANSRATLNVVIVGHTDTVGSGDYNDRLSLARAAAVEGAMTSMGVSGEVMTSTGLGENELAVPTGDGIKERRNRRVNITIR